MDMLTSGIGGIASRTPINFGEAVSDIMSKSLPEYEPLHLGHTPQYLVFAYRRRYAADRYSFIILIADRTSGKVSAEVAISSSDKVPYYKLSRTPRLGVFGFRERAEQLLLGFDCAYTYHSKAELERVLREMLSMSCNQAMRICNEEVDPILMKSKNLWGPIYEEWRLAEQSLGTASVEGLRYKQLANEGEVREFIAKKLEEPLIVRFLGTLRSRYKEEEFLNCHVYLMARGLEFIDDGMRPLSADEAEKAQSAGSGKEERITWGDIMGEGNAEGYKQERRSSVPSNMAAPLDDITMHLTGRLPQELAIKFSDDPRERYWLYVFCQTLSVVEVLYRPNKSVFEF